MFVPRRSHRVRVVLPATLEISRAGGPSRRLAAWTLDLGRDGVGLFVEEPFVQGELVRVIVQDGPPSRRRSRNWSGRVVNVADGKAGQRIGISFDDPDAGPSISFAIRSRPGSSAVSILRVDPPWSDPSPTPSEEPIEVSQRSRAPRSHWAFRIFQAIVFVGFVGDQVTKAIAFSANRGLGSPVKNFGSLGGGKLGVPFEPEILTFVALALTGVVARWALRLREQWKPIDALGWGCLFSGLLGNAVDRLTLGYVRDFFQSRFLPSWVFNLADLLAVLGAFFLILAWAGGRDAFASNESSSRTYPPPTPKDLRVI